MTSLTQNYKIFLVDDHAILREGLKKLVSETQSLEVAGEASNGRDFLHQLENNPCDLVILDISMPDMDGLKVVEKLKEMKPHLKILILTMHDNREFFRHAIAMGVDGYMLKEDVYERLISAIKRIRDGERAYSTRISDHFLQDFVKEVEDAEPSIDLLTRREREILAQVAQGHTSKGIGDMLGISSRTVESHRARIMEKLKIHNVAGLVKFAMNKNLL